MAKGGDYGELAGRVGRNAGSMFIPLKIPCLGKLGKFGKAQKLPATAGAARSSDDGALNELGRARQSGKGRPFADDVALRLADDFRLLDEAERVRFLESLTPDELLSLYV